MYALMLAQEGGSPGGGFPLFLLFVSFIFNKLIDKLIHKLYIYYSDTERRIKQNA